MKHKLLSLCIAAAAAFAGNASAAVNFAYNGPIKIKFSNWENLSIPATCAGPTTLGTECADGVEDNYGVLAITQILTDDGFNTVLWSTGQGGSYLSGIFYGLDVHKVTAGVGTFQVESTGGFLDIYETSNPLNASQGTGGYYNTNAVTHDEYTGISDTGSLYLKLQFVSGINPADGATTVTGNFNALSLPTKGDAASYLDVLGGSAADKFDTDGFSTAFGNRDMLSTSVFCTNGQLACPGQPGVKQGDWDLLSEDPVRANMVPEPGALLLVGTSLLGLGLARRRAKKSA